jgi:hypothetical protein
MVDQLLGELFGAQDDKDDAQRRRRATDFVDRYEQGPPWTGIGDDEVLQNYRAAAGQLSPQEYENAAAEAFARLSREERRALRRRLREQRGGQFDADNDDPRTMAREVSQSRQQGSDDPLGGLFGGLFGGRDQAPAPSGQQAQPQSRQGGGVDEILSTPLGKVVLGGIAAFALKQMMDRDNRL